MGAQAARLSNVDIDNALENKDFEVLFQPIFDLGNGGLARMESFVRWRHPSLGILPPGAFISFFESQGRMSELTRYVLAETLSAYKKWRGTSGPGFSINLALSDLTDEAFTPHFVKLLRDEQFPADLITLECPMPAVDLPVDQAALQYAKLNETGARLAIEVRGRANDMLRTINPFPFDEIKTGGSSILRFARTVRGPGLSAISDLLDIANRANAVITAVGVEDQASLAALRGLGFTAAQGNHLGKVGSLADFLPGKVNDVRSLLNLETLSTDDLNALFRTKPPLPETSDLEKLKVVDEKPDATATEPKIEEIPADSVTVEEDDPLAALKDVDDLASTEDAARKAKARERAKALILAKRAKAREARKSAAIARAKAKVANAKDQAEDTATATPVAEPIALQERLNQEFADGPQPLARTKSPEQSGETVPPQLKQAPGVQKPDATQNAAKSKREEKLSVPERLAAAMGSDVDFKSPTARKQRPMEKKSSTQPPGVLTLAVSNAHAYFQPGIFVGGPAFEPRLETSETRAAKALRETPAAPTTNMPAMPPEAVVPSSPEQKPAAKELAAKSAHEQLPEPQKFEIPTEQSSSIVTEDAIEEAPVEPKIAKPSRRQRKSFLARTVVPYPTHFWPKPWVRTIRRMKSNNASSQNAQAAQ